MVGNDRTMLQCVVSGGTVTLQWSGRQQCKNISEGRHGNTTLLWPVDNMQIIHESI